MPGNFHHSASADVGAAAVLWVDPSQKCRLNKLSQVAGSISDILQVNSSHLKGEVLVFFTIHGL